MPTAQAKIGEVSLWQALRIPLALHGASVSPNAPIVRNKEGIVRVYVAPEAGFRARPLSVLLEWGSLAFESKKAILSPSRDAEFSTTFNFPLDGSRVVAGVSYSVTLRDELDGQILDRFPSSGRSPLGVSTTTVASQLELVVVPIVVAGEEPDVTPATLERFRARLLAMYPLAALSLTTHSPVVTTLSVGFDQGWGALLDLLYTLRAADAPAPNVFYYGLFTPKKRFQDYCVRDCTVGYSVVAQADDVDSRGAIGLGVFSDGSNADAPDTLAHELGHALGRQHAPCDVSTQDVGPFPYPGGKIGVWGFDSQHHLLLDPLLYGDVMGYCSPDWISDFTYQAIFERLQRVNGELTAKSRWLGQSAASYRRLLLGSDGSLAWGSRFTPSRAPAGTTREVQLLARDGRILSSYLAPFRPYSAAEGGFLLIPEAWLVARAAGVRLAVAGHSLDLPAP